MVVGSSAVLIAESSREAAARKMTVATERRRQATQSELGGGVSLIRWTPDKFTMIKLPQCNLKLIGPV
eukprot:scaffold10764_cov159-Ochromonas_danica.AAC.41